MISKYNHKELNWVDLDSPQEEEILHTIEQYPLPQVIKDKLILKKKEDEIDINYDFIYISINNEITLFVNDDLVISIHSGQTKAMDQLSKELELDMVENEKINDNKILFAHLLKNLYINSQKQLSDSSNHIKSLKNQITKNNKRIKKLIIFIILLIILSIIFICL